MALDLVEEKPIDFFCPERGKSVPQPLDRALGHGKTLSLGCWAWLGLEGYLGGEG